MVGKKRRITRIFVVCGLVLMLGGCSTLYFHDDDREKAFNEAKESFDKADPSSLFKEQREFFAKLKTEEEKAVLGQLIATRDLRLALLINDKVTDPDDQKKKIGAWQGLLAEVDARGKRLLGDVDKGWLATFKSLNVHPEFIRHHNHQVLRRQARLNKVRARYKKAVPKAKRAKDLCEIKDGKISANPHPAKTPAHTLFGSLERSCKAYKRTKTNSLEKLLNAALPESLVAKVGAKIIKLRNELSQEAAQRENAKAAVEELKKAVAKAEKEKKDEEKRDKQKAAVSKFLGKLKDFDKFGKSEAFAHLVGIFDAVVADSDSAAPADKKFGPAPLVVSALIRATRERNKAKRKAAADARLIQMSFYKYQLAVADGAISMLKKRLLVLESQLIAIAAELELLVDVVATGSPTGQACEDAGFAKIMKECADDTKKAAARALARYSASWLSGRAAQRVSRLRDAQFQREWALSQEELSTQAWTGMLKPVISQLVAFGKGGIKQETVIELLKLAGLAVIATRVGD